MEAYPNASDPPDVPRTSLIIPSRNRPELLLATVRSILQGDEIPSELIVVDQSDAPHSTLTTLGTDRACKIRYLRTESVGVSRARNIGIGAARYDILAFTDDDVAVTTTWFGALVRSLRRAGPQAVISGRVLPGIVQKRGGFVPSTKTDENRTEYAGRVGEDVLYTGNMALFRSTLTQIGGFDERLGPGTFFPAAEDNDLGFRLLEAGYRIIYEPRAVLYHRAWRSADDYIPLNWRYGRGQGGYYAKHISIKDRHMLWRMCSDILRRTFKLVDRSWRRPREACGRAAFISGVIFGTIHWAWTHRRVYR
jgi:GT2 family glycosyltransferase